MKQLEGAKKKMDAIIATLVDLTKSGKMKWITSPKGDSDYPYQQHLASWGPLTLTMLTGSIEELTITTHGQEDLVYKSDEASDLMELVEEMSYKDEKRNKLKPYILQELNRC